MRKKTGFTLIELLVVIAIIAILAAILFPVFARARAKAMQNNCLSNVKQLQLGVMMYTSDYDQRSPFYGGGFGASIGWACQIYPYVKNLQIYECPSWGQRPDPVSGVVDYGGYGDYTGTNPYGMGTYVGYGFQTHYRNGSLDAGYSVAALDTPAERMGVFEVLQGNSVGCGDIANMASRHMDGGNVGYMDGHAKWLSTSFVADTFSCTALNTPADPNNAAARHFWLGMD